MARIRSVHPGICSSEDMVDMPAEVERTYVRLWTHCDDDGRAKDNPRLIKAALFPLLDDMTAEVIDEHLDELAKRDLIVRYEVEGVRYLSIPSWERWQKPQKKRPSLLPAPSETPTGDVREQSRTDTGTVEDESGPVVGGGEGEGVGEGVGETLPAVPDAVRSVFDEWVTVCGKTGRTQLDHKRRRLIVQALKAYPLDDVLDAVRGWKRSKFHRGENAMGRVYNDLELLLRDAAHIEGFRDMHRHPEGEPVPDRLRGIVKWLVEEAE